MLLGIVQEVCDEAFDTCALQPDCTRWFIQRTADVTGSILGVVRDATQAVVANARIVATNAETNFSKETVSAPDGSYRLLALPAGTYSVTATASGFQQYTTTNVDVKVNDQLRVDVTLQVGSVQQEVNVTANAVQVETETTQLGEVIESKKMLALPLNGRSYIDLLGLQAGVVPFTSGSIQQDRPVSGYLSNTAMFRSMASEKLRTPSWLMAATSVRAATWARAWSRIWTRSRNSGSSPTASMPSTASSARGDERRHQVGNQQYSRRCVRVHSQ